MSKRRKISESQERQEEDYVISKGYDPYYLVNFKCILHHVVDSIEGHVLSADDHSIISTFQSLPGILAVLLRTVILVDNAQCLLLRLYLRKHHWIRCDKLSYTDISSDIMPLIVCLVENQLLDNGKYIYITISK